MVKGLYVASHVMEGPGAGWKVTKAIAHHGQTQDAVGAAAESLGRSARRFLGAADARTGTSDIEVTNADDRYSKIDKFVTLTDERGFGAAMTIEYGMSPGIDEDGYYYPGTKAVAPLRKAAGLNIPLRRRSATKRISNRRSRRFRIAGGVTFG